LIEKGFNAKSAKNTKLKYQTLTMYDILSCLASCAGILLLLFVLLVLKYLLPRILYEIQ
jgi:hypothetical protein